MRNQTEIKKFFEEQLFKTKQALFTTNSVKRIKFLQNKINYLKQRIKEVEK